MLCIAAFIVLLVLSAVSARYRKLLGKAASCTWRRVTLRPCDTTFRDDLKNSLLAPLAVRSPRLVKPASIAIEVLAWVMVLSMIVSLYIVGRSGLNLFVYGTCDKQNAQACTLSAEVCSVGDGTTPFWDSILAGNVIGAFGDEFASLGDTFSAIPSRLRTWEGAEFASASATYLEGYREGLPVAVEVIDPGCRFCAQLFRNVEESGLAQTHNVTYLVYPIASTWGDKFEHSALIARYLTAIQLHEREASLAGESTTDWLILEQIFGGDNASRDDWQVWFNETATDEEAVAQLHTWLSDAGYDAAGIAQIDDLAGSPEVADSLAAVRQSVEDDIRTVSIPTMILDGRLRTGVVSVDDLRAAR